MGGCGGPVGFAGASGEGDGAEEQGVGAGGAHALQWAVESGAQLSGVGAGGGLDEGDEAFVAVGVGYADEQGEFDAGDVQGGFVQARVDVAGAAQHHVLESAGEDDAAVRGEGGAVAGADPGVWFLAEVAVAGGGAGEVEFAVVGEAGADAGQGVADEVAVAGVGALVALLDGGKEAASK